MKIVWCKWGDVYKTHNCRSAKNTVIFPNRHSLIDHITVKYMKNIII